MPRPFHEGKFGAGRGGAQVPGSERRQADRGQERQYGAFREVVVVGINRRRQGTLASERINDCQTFDAASGLEVFGQQLIAFGFEGGSDDQRIVNMESVCA